jgi:hypothetical protein
LIPNFLRTFTTLPKSRAGLRSRFSIFSIIFKFNQFYLVLIIMFCPIFLCITGDSQLLLESEKKDSLGPHSTIPRGKVNCIHSPTYIHHFEIIYFVFLFPLSRNSVIVQPLFTSSPDPGVSCDSHQALQLRLMWRAYPRINPDAYSSPSPIPELSSRSSYRSRLQLQFLPYCQK